MPTQPHGTTVDTLHVISAENRFLEHFFLLLQ